jgi:hypothetical protein
LRAPSDCPNLLQRAERAAQLGRRDLAKVDDRQRDRYC